MPAPMVLLRRPTNSNTLPILTVLFTLYLTSTPYRWGVTPPLGHLELNVTDPDHNKYTYMHTWYILILIVNLIIFYYFVQHTVRTMHKVCCIKYIYKKNNVYYVQARVHINQGSSQTTLLVLHSLLYIFIIIKRYNYVLVWLTCSSNVEWISLSKGSKFCSVLFEICIIYKIRMVWLNMFMDISS